MLIIKNFCENTLDYTLNMYARKSLAQSRIIGDYV